MHGENKLYLYAASKYMYLHKSDKEMQKAVKND